MTKDTATKVVLKTNKGDITIELYSDMPITAGNFENLAQKGTYNGVIFHRVIEDFMIQGGDPSGTGAGGDSIWGRPFVNEVTDEVLFDRKGLVAMANSGRDTNKSQFFITVKEAPHLNMKHTIFGEVASGYDVVESISKVTTDSNDRPRKEQKILKAYLGNPESKRRKK